MATRIQTGALAESFVAQELELLGWQLLGRNLRTPYAEVDLLAQTPRTTPRDQPWLVVVEVKARHPLSWLQGEDRLRPTQRQRLARALLWLTRHRQWPGPSRIDLACVEMLSGLPLHWRLLEGVMVAR